LHLSVNIETRQVTQNEIGGGGVCTVFADDEFIQFYSENLTGPLGRSRCRWKNTIKIKLKKQGVNVWNGLNWLGKDFYGGHW
jgi:hypothetical protein